MVEELKACPWCQGQAELREDTDPKYPWSVISKHTNECFLAYSNVNRHRSYETADQAITAWNTRTLPKGSVEKVAQHIHERRSMVPWDCINQGLAIQDAQAALAALGMKEEGV